MEWLTGVSFAHRGLHDPAVRRPENSLAAFEAAVEAGYGIELDVHLGADGTAVVFHDPGLERMCGVTGRIAEVERPRLRELRLAGTDECVPSLDDVLQLVDGRAPLLVELKPPEVAPRERLCAVVAQLLSRYPGPAAVMAFDPRLLAWFRRHQPDRLRGQLGASRRVPAARAAADAAGLRRWQQWALEYLAVAAYSRPHFIGYDVRALHHPAPVVARRCGPLLAGIVTNETELAVARARADSFIFEGFLP